VQTVAIDVRGVGCGLKERYQSSDRLLIREGRLTREAAKIPRFLWSGTSLA